MSMTKSPMPTGFPLSFLLPHVARVKQFVLSLSGQPQPHYHRNVKLGPYTIASSVILRRLLFMFWPAAVSILVEREGIVVAPICLEQPVVGGTQDVVYADSQAREACAADHASDEDHQIKFHRYPSIPNDSFLDVHFREKVVEDVVAGLFVHTVFPAAAFSHGTLIEEPYPGVSAFDLQLAAVAVQFALERFPVVVEVRNEHIQHGVDSRLTSKIPIAETVDTRAPSSAIGSNAILTCYERIKIKAWNGPKIADMHGNASVNVLFVFQSIRPG